MPQDSTYRKKLIEVSLPLDAINAASAREKSIRHGHPSTLHLWWARRPLAACRAVLFSSLVNDPGDDPMYSLDESVAATERGSLHSLIEDLVLWENSNNPDVINRARLEIARSIAANKVADGELEDDAQLVSTAPELPEEQAKYLPDPPPEYTPHDVRFKMPGLKPEQVNHFLAHYAPPVLDPFAGGGSIPLEAQRLGLRAYASDLNPVPVLINKALIEMPPRFAGQPPVNPEAQQGKLATKVYSGAEGLAEDVRYYGKWMRDEAEKRIGHLYPKVKVTQQMVDDGRPDLEPYAGQELTVLAWIWARTVKSPNPAVGQHKVPLMRGYWLSKRKGKEAYVEPIIDGNGYNFKVRIRKGSADFDPSKGTVKRSGGTCLLSGVPIPFPHIREAGKAGELGTRLVCTVCEGTKGRVYLDPTVQHAELARVAVPDTAPTGTISHWPGRTNVVEYGMDEFDKLFTNRQLTTLTTFSDLIADLRQRVVADAESHPDNEGYATAVGVYLAFTLDRLADLSNALNRWEPNAQCPRQLFARQAIPMVWDFAEGNPLGNSSGSWNVLLRNLDGAFTSHAFTASPAIPGTAKQNDAAVKGTYSGEVISCDPPYYDNICYADLSDFFYIWLRRSLQDCFPDLLSTMLTPKSDELIAKPYRHNNSKQEAAAFFEQGLGNAIREWHGSGSAEYPTSIFYAFKQAETDSGGTASTGWETFLAGIIETGYSITATWPLRTECGSRMIGQGANALASSIVLSCVARKDDASMVTRRDFANALRKELPEAIKHLQSGNVAPVDLAQASIGPGMAVFSRYSKVVNADGSPMSVREALQLINQVLDESLVEQESDFDAETRFALRWFEQFGMTEGPFGDAETLAKAMAVSVTGIVEAGVAKSGAGKVRLLKRNELDPTWDPDSDDRLTIWEITQYLIHRLETRGEQAAAALLHQAGLGHGEIARDLSYRLYQTCERNSLAEEARSYNALVVSWPEISKLARGITTAPKQQREMHFQD